MLSNLIDRMKLPFRKDKELYLSLRKIIGFYPHDISYYKLALMHKSMYKRNAKGKPVNNERLEFLGDAVLDATVGDIVYRHFPGKREGFLTNTRSKLVQRDTLNRLAQEMGINQLILSSGRSQSHNSYMGGNAFEALVGAIYLDRDYDACMKFMRKRILTQMINIDKVAYKEVNFKSKLIEWSQKNRVRIDFKSILEEKDKTGSPVFIYRVMLEGVEGCDGKGYSKKESQQLASKLTLEKLRREPQFIDQVFAAKTNRTKMEEEPVENVPSTEQPDDFIVVSSGMEVEVEGSGASNGSNSDSDYRGSISSINSSDSRRSSDSRNSSDSRDSIDSNDSNNPKAKRNRRSPMYRKDEAAEAATATKTEATKSVEPVSSKLTSADLNLSDEDFDLSHISAKEQTREEIIAAAEAAAFGDA